jgi:catechol 2,3-dioxygenase
VTVPVAPEPGYQIPASAGIAHAHLRVADLGRALDFYCGVLGFGLMARYQDSAYLAAGGSHHCLALATWRSGDEAAPAVPQTGLHHLAIRYPSREDLAVAVRRVLSAGVPLSRACDHGVSVSVYLVDPDGTGLELTWDRPPEEWPSAGDGRAAAGQEEPLDPEVLAHR